MVVNRILHRPLVLGALLLMLGARPPVARPPVARPPVARPPAAWPPVPRPPAKVPLSRYLTETSWNALFPHRYALEAKGKDFYSFKAFETAAARFPTFLSEPDETGRKRELAAFLANVSQETGGGWADAPGGYFKWGLYFISENKNKGLPGAYRDSTKHHYPPAPGQSYYGRGPFQLSWNYNYGQFSEAWFADKNILLANPDTLAKDPVLAFGSALWFWTTPQHPKPSCHDVMSGAWQPTPDDVAKGRKPGFGATVNLINGGVECGSGTDEQRTQYRYAYYKYFCNYLHVSPGANIECTNQRPFGQ